MAKVPTKKVKTEDQDETKSPKVKAAPKGKAEPKAEKVKVEKPTYGANYIAEQLGISSAVVRNKLRVAKVEKAGRSYSWSTKREADEVLKVVKTTKLKNEE